MFPLPVPLVPVRYLWALAFGLGLQTTAALEAQQSSIIAPEEKTAAVREAKLL